MAKKPRKFKMEDRDKGFNKVMDLFEHLKAKPYVKVGFPSALKATKSQKTTEDSEGNTVETDKTVLEVAVIHEFGLGVPQRSFIRATHDEKRNEWRKKTNDLFMKLLDGKMSVNQALGIMGEMILGDQKGTVRKRIPPPLKNPSKKRGANPIPLIDTSQMINSMGYSRRGVKRRVRIDVERPK